MLPECDLIWGAGIGGVTMSVVSSECNGSGKSSYLHLEPFRVSYFSVAVPKRHDQTNLGKVFILGGARDGMAAGDRAVNLRARIFNHQHETERAN